VLVTLDLFGGGVEFCTAPMVRFNLSRRMRLARLNFEVVSLEQPAFHRQRSLFPTTACMAKHAMRCHMGRFTGKGKMFGCSVCSWIERKAVCFM